MRSAFAGPSTFGAAQTVQGGGGYVYKIFDDGRIQIVSSPRGGAGTFVQQGSAAYDAILMEQYDRMGGSGSSSTRKRASAEQILSAAERGAGVLETGVSLAERIQSMVRGGGLPAAVAPAVEPAYTPPTLVESKGPSIGVILGIGGVLVLIVGGLALAGRD